MVDFQWVTYLEPRHDKKDTKEKVRLYLLIPQTRQREMRFASVALESCSRAGLHQVWKVPIDAAHITASQSHH